MPQTREEYEQMKTRLESGGFTVITKWRKGLKQIRLGDIVLSEPDIPMPVMVRRWECPFCHRRRSAKAVTAEHIARCWLNPAVRACKTCAHYESWPAGEDCFPGRPCACNAGGQECHAGVSLPSSGLPVTACLLWLARTEEDPDGD